MRSLKRAVFYAVICAAAFFACVVIAGKSGIEASDARVDAPASLDGAVTISTSHDGTLTFITCAPFQPKLWQRLLRRPSLSAAFAVQERPMHDAVTHTGNAHIEFEGNLLSVAFTDSSRYVFTIAPRGTLQQTDGAADYVIGIGTYRVAGLRTHAAFVASRDWSRRACGL